MQALSFAEEPAEVPAEEPAARSARAARPTSARARLAGRILGAVPAFFLAFDAALKLVHPAVVTEASMRLGWPDPLNAAIAGILLAILALHLVPRTAVFGAVLITGYLGGAVAMHARIGDPLWSHTLVPVYVAVLIWAGLYLRDARVRRAVGPAARARSDHEDRSQGE